LLRAIRWKYPHADITSYLFAARCRTFNATGQSGIHENWSVFSQIRSGHPLQTCDAPWKNCPREKVAKRSRITEPDAADFWFRDCGCVQLTPLAILSSQVGSLYIEWNETVRAKGKIDAVSLTSFNLTYFVACSIHWRN